VTAPNHDASGAEGSIAAEAGASRNFTQRLISAAVLAPLSLICTYVGGWLFMLACALAAAAILWEWISLVLGRSGTRGTSDGNGAAWIAAGVIYAGLAFAGPVLLRNDPKLGLAALFFLFATVWATDILAYLVGRAVGGPLLWPSVSPKKTWSGACGGLAGGVAAGTLVAYASAGTAPLMAGILALVLSVAAQIGDLFESAVKRRFGAKDASGLIPGHGGVMDRLDGFLVAAAAAVVIAIVRHGLVQGLAAPAQGLLVW
jgi:phosphatidate cytidylyltransferase